MSGSVKVLGAWPSPFAMRVMLALKVKEVPYELVETCPFQKSEALLKANPVYKKIPVLLHGDRTICESMIIVEYVDSVWEAAAPPILPADPYHLAKARFWATVIDDKLFPATMRLAKAETAEDGAKAVEELLAVMQLLEGALGECGTPAAGFFGGDRIGYVDISLGGFATWLRAIGKMCGVELFHGERTPLLARWLDRFCAEESVRAVLPDTDTLVHFFRDVLLPKFKAAAAAAAN